MSGAHDLDGQLRVLYFIHYAVIADADSAQAGEPTLSALPVP